MNKIHYLFLTSLFVMVYSVGTAQIPFTVDWNNAFEATLTNNNFSNEASKMVTDPADGSVYVLADVTSDLDAGGNITGLTYNYVAIIKYDISGNLLDSILINIAQHTVNGFNYKSSFGLAIDGSGNIIAGYNSFDGTTQFDVNITKFDTNLNQIWTYKYNSNNNDRGVDMLVSPTGTVYVVAQLTTSTGNVRSFVIKATGSGTSNMAFYTFTGSDVLGSIALDPLGNIYLTGYRQLNGNKSIAIASVTAAGVLRWTRYDNQGSAGRDDIGKQIIYGSDGFVYLTGSTTGTTQQGTNVITIKLNPPNGKKVWENIIHVSLNDAGIKIKQTASGILFVAWQSTNSVYAEMISANTGLRTMRAVYTPVPGTSSYNSLDGASVSDMQISMGNILYLSGNLLATDSSNDQFYSSYLLKFDFTSRASGVALIGELFNEGIFQKSARSVGIALNEYFKKVYFIQDIANTHTSHLIEKIDVYCLATAAPFKSAQDNISESATSDFSVSTYTQDVMNTLMISANQNIKFIDIYDITGKLVISKIPDVNGMKSEVDIAILKSGIYLVRVASDSGKISTSKIIKN